MITRSQYLKQKDRILKSKMTDLEKSSKLFNNWVDYVFDSANSSERTNIKYNQEQVRVNYK